LEKSRELGKAKPAEIKDDKERLAATVMRLEKGNGPRPAWSQKLGEVPTEHSDPSDSRRSGEVLEERGERVGLKK